MGLYVVTGPPAAGKSTWVRARAKPGDIVVDYDRLAGALTIEGDNHDHHKIVRHVAHRARSAAIGEALKHTAAVDVYIIHSLPSHEMSQRYAEHDAVIVTIDPGRDVVMARIREQRPHHLLAVAERWYATNSSHTQSTPTRSSRSW